jgi:hypothetical protein
LKRRRLGQVVWRGIREKQNYMKDITWLMEPNYDTIWCKPHKHLVTKPTCKPCNSWKAKKSGLKVWHRDYLEPKHQHYWNLKPLPNWQQFVKGSIRWHHENNCSLISPFGLLENQSRKENSPSLKNFKRSFLFLHFINWSIWYNK